MFHTIFPLRRLLPVEAGKSPRRTSDFGLRTSDTAGRKAGFSLIEVNVAILVIAGGMLSLFTLFPAGLRMSTAAMSDTRQAFFADQFFAFFENGLLTSTKMQDVWEWQDIEEFWKAGRHGVEEGFDITLDNKDWPDDSDLEKAIIGSWDPSGLEKSSFKKTRGSGSDISLRFRSGAVEDYFSESTGSGSSSGTLGAEFVVRITSDFAHLNSQGNPTHNNDDGLVWRVSLVVSDEGENGWFYDNPVYHRDFRYAELP